MASDFTVNKKTELQTSSSPRFINREVFQSASSCIPIVNTVPPQIEELLINLPTSVNKPRKKKIESNLNEPMQSERQGHRLKNLRGDDLTAEDIIRGVQNHKSNFIKNFGLNSTQITRLKT
jgi:hypothetical protein